MYCTYRFVWLFGLPLFGVKLYLTGGCDQSRAAYLAWSHILGSTRSRWPDETNRPIAAEPWSSKCWKNIDKWGRLCRLRFHSRHYSTPLKRWWLALKRKGLTSVFIPKYRLYYKYTVYIKVHMRWPQFAWCIHVDAVHHSQAVYLAYTHFLGLTRIETTQNSERLMYAAEPSPGAMRFYCRKMSRLIN